MRDGKGLGGYGIKGLRKTILNAGFLIFPCGCGTRFRADWGGDWSRHRGCGTRSRAQRTRSPDAGRGADAGREGRFDIMQKARMFVKVGWEERKQRFGIMHNVEMFRLAP